VAEAEYTTTARLPVETIWEFVREMDHWAPLVTGYQGHVKESEDDSVWTLKGDVGVLARVVRFRVHITEWAGPERVRFALEGLNEPMKGEGLFEMAPLGAGAPAVLATPPPRLPFWRRWAIALTRLLFRLQHGRVERAALPAESAAGARLTFRLRIEPGGPMGPLVNAMMQPAMVPFAEDLANRIMAHLEAQYGLRA
jgi:carbon monoxide dehydrogenase subunit G